MFVYYFAMVNAAFADVRGRIGAMPETIQRIGTASYRSGEELRARLRAGRFPLLAKAVRVTVSPAVIGEHEANVRIGWEATGTPGLFPTMDGEIVAAHLGDGVTQLSFRGSYEVPFGAFGQGLNRGLFHRIAEASVKDFMDRLAAELNNIGTSIDLPRSDRAIRRREGRRAM